MGSRENKLKQNKAHLKMNNKQDKRKAEKKRRTEQESEYTWNSTMKNRRKRKIGKEQDTDLQETEWKKIKKEKDNTQTV